MSQRVRYTVNDVNNNRFFQMPKFLFEGEFRSLSNDARILYSLLRDRHELSLSNKWINENGEVYLIYTRKNMEEMLGLTDKPVKKAVDQLKNLGLLEEERMGLNKANRIYLTSTSLDTSGIGDSPIQEPEILRFKNRKTSDSKTVELPIQESEILRTNDTNISDTKLNNTDQSINQSAQPTTNNVDQIRLIERQKKSHYPLQQENAISQVNPMDFYRNIISQNIEYEHLKTYLFKNDGIIDDVFELILEIVTSNKPTIRVAGEDKSTNVVKEAFLKLDAAHIEYVITSVQQSSVKANNIKSYMITALYNAPLTINSYYTNLAQHNLYGLKS